MAEPKKLNRIVIKEELVQLTGDFKLAIVLNQMIYWSERRHDADKFIAEEKERFNRQYNNPTEIVFMEPSYGWIYKKAEELVAETMMGLTVKTMLNYLNELTAKGWLQKRRNPKHDFDRTYQYRVDLIKIQTDLLELGYALDGYDLGITNCKKVNSEISASIDNDNFENQEVNTKCKKVNSEVSGFNGREGLENPNLRNCKKVNTKSKNENTNDKKVNSYCKNVRAIPETTSETTTEITSENNILVDVVEEGQEVTKQFLKDKFLEKFNTTIPDSLLPYFLTLEVDQIELILGTLKEKYLAGLVSSPVGILIKNPESVINNILAGLFFPEPKSSVSVNEPEYSVFEKYSGIQMLPPRRNTYNKWRLQWGFTAEAILKAAELMCLYTSPGTMEYIDRILNNWYKNNIKTLEDINITLKKHDDSKKKESKFQEFYT